MKIIKTRGQVLDEEAKTIKGKRFFCCFLPEGNGLNGQRIVRDVCAGGSQHSVATLARTHTHSKYNGSAPTL